MLPEQGTAGLAFITDSSFREALRFDIDAAMSALRSNGWKAATVLAGSVIEALLLWGILQASAPEIESAKRAVPGTILDPGTTKNDEGRVVYLTPEIATLLEGQLARVETLQKQTGVIIPYLFPHLVGTKRGGQRIHDFRRAWRTACKKAGAPGMLRHDFRRTAVRNMVNAGVVERVAMTVTGTRRAPSFDRHHIVSPGDLQDIARKLAGITNAAGKKTRRVRS